MQKIGFLLMICFLGFSKTLLAQTDEEVDQLVKQYGKTLTPFNLGMKKSEYLGVLEAIRQSNDVSIKDFIEPVPNSESFVLKIGDKSASLKMFVYPFFTEKNRLKALFFYSLEKTIEDKSTRFETFTPFFFALLQSFYKEKNMTSSTQINYRDFAPPKSIIFEGKVAIWKNELQEAVMRLDATCPLDRGDVGKLIFLCGIPF